MKKPKKLFKAQPALKIPKPTKPKGVKAPKIPKFMEESKSNTKVIK